VKVSVTTYKVTWPKYRLAPGSFAVGHYSNESYTLATDERLFSTREKADEFASMINQAHKTLGQLMNPAIVSEHTIE
jgi:hypothetical protein